MKMLKSALMPLTKSHWLHDEWSTRKFVEMIECHAKGDADFGSTCLYAPDGEGLTSAEVEAMLKEGALRPEFEHDGWVNQHWLHSLEQFYAVVIREWLAHVARTDALLGTPAGRIQRRKG